MSRDILLDFDAFIRSIKQNQDISHSILIGAGASVSSGVQSAGDCIWEWKKDIFLSQNPNAPDYYKNIKSDLARRSIQGWLDGEGIYPALNSAEEYSFYAERAYPIADDRRKYFQRLSQNREPYVGYKLLCLLNELQIVKAVWTPNFDGLTVKAAHQANLTPIEITLDSVDRIFRNQSNKELLCIALHGDYKYGALKNTSHELDNRVVEFVDTFKRYHTDKNLVVIGYSGRDHSLMQTLRESFSVKGSGRLYWCGYGHEIYNEVRELISIARQAGREAYFVPTDGFDSTLIRIAKACIEDRANDTEKLEKILSSAASAEANTTPFSHETTRADKYLKSNLHPITFPKEIFQFEVRFEQDEKPWATLRELCGSEDIVAVPFKKKVFALSTQSIIHKVFKDRLKGNITRVPISKFDIGNVTAFKSLMLKATLRGLTDKKEIDHNGKDKLWVRTPDNYSTLNGQKIGIHNAISVSLFFDSHPGYAFLSFVPAVHFTAEGEISKEVKQQLSKSALEKLRNKQYDTGLEAWKGLLFKSPKIKFEYPFDSGTAFEFSISSSTSFAEIMVHDPNRTNYQPRSYDRRLTQHRGVQLMEPQLIFTQKNQIAQTKDFHPMRALVAHRPYDVLLNGQVYSSEIGLGVICPAKHSSRFQTFLNELHQKHPAQVNQDYLIEYPGFSAAFKIPLNIPAVENTDRWIDIEAEHTNDSKASAVQLARQITSKIDQLARTHSNMTAVVFIPNEWQMYREYDDGKEGFDLHDYVKSYAAARGISTQLIEEDTLDDKLKCQIFWWLALSFYVKSFRNPWILNTTDKTTAFAGIGYSIKKRENETEIVLGCSHIYNSQGQGLKYKLAKVDDFFLDGKGNPFMSYNDAFQFGVSIRELFYASMDTLPERVVVHKRTRFTSDEVKGITDSLRMAGIKSIDLIEMNYEPDARFVATSIYDGEMQIDGFPVSRGTCMVTDKHSALLWTHGIVPSVKDTKFKYYLGGRSIPAPLRIVKHYGSSNINVIATEILGLTKVNWNSFDLYTKLPATINSSNQIARIGKLLARFEGKTYDYRLFI